MLNIIFRKYAIILISSLIIISCVTMTLTDVGKLQKGMSIEEAKRSLPLKPKNEFSLENMGYNIRICTYILSSGDYGSNYFLAFQDGKLLFWGYPHEFARSNDSLINEIGKKSIDVQSDLDKKAKH